MKRTFIVEPDSVALTLDELQGIGPHYEGLHRSIGGGVEKITFTRIEPPPNPVYRYKIETNDGREWTQLIDMNPYDDPLWTYAIEGSWRWSEFGEHLRLLRESLGMLVHDHPDITLVKCVFEDGP